MDFQSCLMIDLGRGTDGNNEICLGVHFALCIIYLFISIKENEPIGFITNGTV